MKRTLRSNIETAYSLHDMNVVAFDVSGGYECDTTKYVPGTAERLADQYLEMLGQQFNNK